MAGYRAGDLERRYPSLDVDEDYLYAYGFTARRLRPLLYPRHDRHSAGGRFVPAGRAADLLAFVRERGVVHPRDAQAHFGHERVTNAWGGVSSATTRELERLRHHGLLRVADRVSGIRRYEAAPPPGDPLDPADRLRALVLLVARTLAPASEATLSTAVSRLVLWAAVPGGRPGGRWVIRDLLARGELAATDVGGVRYVWPAGLERAGPAPRPGCGSWPRSTRWCGTGCGSGSCGGGTTGSRRTRRPGAGCWGTTRCRCCGATGSSGGPPARAAPSRWATPGPRRPAGLTRRRWMPRSAG